MEYERVKLKTRINNYKSRWHLVTWFGDDPRTLCEGWVWWDDDDEDPNEIDDQSGVKPETFKGVEKITCPHCNELIKQFKKI